MGRDSLDIQDHEGEAAAAARYANAVTLKPKPKDAELGRHESADTFVPNGGARIQVRLPDVDDLKLADNVLFWVVDDAPDTWVKVGVALKDALGEHGRALWDTWSKGRDKYDANDQEAKWHSFKKSGTGFDALLQIAKEYNYEPYRKPSSERKKAEQKEATEGKLAKTEDDYEASEPPAGLYIDTGKLLTTFPYQVKKTIPRRGRGILVGQSGVAKTGVAIQLGIVNAAFKAPDGTPFTFFGRRIKEQIGVIYLAAEGEGEIAHRIRAAKLHHGLEADAEIPFAWCNKSEVLDGAASLGDAKGKAGFIKFCQSTARWMRKRFNIRLGLIIGDTASQLYAIEDENSGAEIVRLAKDWGDIIAALEEDCFGLLVVHAGKDAKRGARGSQAWRDNFDIMLMAVGERDELEGTCTDRRLILSKNRHGPEGPITTYDVMSYVLGRDDDGDDFSAQVVFVDETQPVKPAKHAKKRQPKFRAQFEQAFTDAILAHPQKRRLLAPSHVGTPEVTCVKREHVKEEFYRRCSEETPDNKRKAFSRVLEALFREYPQEEDAAGQAWIWRCEP